MKLHRPLIAALIRSGMRAKKLFRRGAAVRAGKLLGALVGRMYLRETLRAQRELRRAFPERGSAWAREASQRVFGHIGGGLLELFALYGEPESVAEIVRCEGFERLEGAMKSGRGAILLSAHLGNWELLGAYMARRLGGLYVVGKKIYYRPYNDAVLTWRKAFGVETVYQDEPPQRLLELLGEGRALGLLADLYSRHVDGVNVEFFGRPAHTATAPASLALSSGAPIVPVFIRREREGDGHFIRVEEPIRAPMAGRKQERVLELTRAWSAAVERAIGRSPEQWPWFHRRWRTRT